MGKVNVYDKIMI